MEGTIIIPTFNEIGWLILHTDRMASKPTWSHNVRLGRGYVLSLQL